MYSLASSIQELDNFTVSYIYNVEDKVKLSNSCIELASEYIYNVEDKVKLSNSCIELASEYIYNVEDNSLANSIQELDNFTVSSTL
jgi:hypothetical protein